MHERPDRQVRVSGRQRGIVVKGLRLDAKNSGRHIATPGGREARDLIGRVTGEGLGVLREGHACSRVLRNAHYGSVRGGGGGRDGP